MSGKELPGIYDSDDLISGCARLPSRHYISWMTRQAYESGQGSICTTSGARTVQPLRASGRCVSGQQGDPARLALKTLSVSIALSVGGLPAAQSSHQGVCSA